MTLPLNAADPKRLGDYELLGRLGTGGQGVVYLGRRVTGPGQVAIKLLHAQMLESKNARARFVRELAMLRRVAGFCTAQVIEADLAGDQPYIVSEYVPGPSLRELVRDQGPRTGADLDRLAISSVTALTAIHRAGIVHRDFKPQNVLMGPDGPRVIDFGIARALDPGATVSNQIVGTPAYMAPEQFAGTGIGPSADMFAWAATLLFAATGRDPFGGGAFPAIMYRVLNHTPDLSVLPDQIADVAAEALSKDPSARPSAETALLRLLGERTAPNRPPATQLVPPNHPARRHNRPAPEAQHDAKTEPVPPTPSDRQHSAPQSAGPSQHASHPGKTTPLGTGTRPSEGILADSQTQSRDTTTPYGAAPPDGPAQPDGAVQLAAPGAAPYPSGTAQPERAAQPGDALYSGGAAQPEGAAQPGGAAYYGGAAQSGGAAYHGGAASPGGAAQPGGAAYPGGAVYPGGAAHPSGRAQPGGMQPGGVIQPGGVPDVGGAFHPGEAAQPDVAQLGGMAQPGGAAQSGGMAHPGGVAQPGGVQPGGVADPGGAVRDGGRVHPDGVAQPGGAVHAGGSVQPGAAVQAGWGQPGEERQADGAVRGTGGRLRLGAATVGGLVLAGLLAALDVLSLAIFVARPDLSSGSGGRLLLVVASSFVFLAIVTLVGVILAWRGSRTAAWTVLLARVGRVPLWGAWAAIPELDVATSAVALYAGVTALMVVLLVLGLRSR